MIVYATVLYLGDCFITAMQRYSSARQPEPRYRCIHRDNFQGKIPNGILINALLDEQWAVSEIPFVKIIQGGVEECLKFVDLQLNLEFGFESNLCSILLSFGHVHIYFSMHY